MGGVVALAVASLPRAGAAERAPGDATAVLAELEAQGGAATTRAPLQAGNAAVPTQEPTAAPGSVIKAIAPVDAKGVSGSGFKPIAGGGAAAQKQVQSAPPVTITGPWMVSVEGSPPAELLRALISAFEAKGIQLLPAGSTSGPDAALSLTTAPGGAAWYCESPRSISSGWATALLNALPSSADQPAPSSFSCASLQDERPRTPSALLQVPSNLDATAFSKRLADSVSTYLGKNGPALRRARAGAQLAWPAAGPITSAYGPAHPLGIDIGQWAGPIRAATDGTVYFAGGDPCCSYGRFVVIDSPDGIRTLYGHLDSLAVKKGDKVKAGQTLGQVGCTGTCFGTHLHFEVIDGGIRQDPMAYLP